MKRYLTDRLFNADDGLPLQENVKVSVVLYEDAMKRIGELEDSLNNVVRCYDPQYGCQLESRDIKAIQALLNKGE